MEARDTLIGVAALLAAVGVGYAAGRATVSGSDPGVVEGTLRDEEVRQLHELVVELEADLARVEQRRGALELELFGDPLPWTGDLDERYQPTSFEQTVRRAVDQCEPAAEIVGFDCSEPPCYVLLRITGPGLWSGLVDDCPAWVEPYGSAVSSFTTGVSCPGGGAERMAMIGPPASQVLGDDPEVREHWSRRWDLRVQTAKLEWVCAEP